MKLLFVLTILLFNVSSYARDRVLVLTSLKEPEKRSVNLSKNRKNFFQAVENIARKKLDNEYDVEVLHNVTPYQLYESVTSGNYKAIFWISHANKKNSLGNGMASENIIADQNGVDVKNIFYLLNPMTQYIALIGCYSSFFSDDLKKNFSETERANTIVNGFDNKIDILKGLRRNLRTFKNFKSLPHNQIETKTAPAIKVSLSRQSGDKQLPSVFIYNRKKLLKVLPELSPHSFENYEIEIEEVKDAADLKIVISTEKLLLDTISSEDFGEMNITSSLDNYGQFKLAVVGGKPLGTRTRIFKFEGSLAQKK